MMLKSSLCYYSDAYIFVKGTISVANTAAAAAATNNAYQKIIFKNCAQFDDFNKQYNTHLQFTNR